MVALSVGEKMPVACVFFCIPNDPITDSAFCVVSHRKQCSQIVVAHVLDKNSWQGLPHFLHTGPVLYLNGERQQWSSKIWHETREPRTGVGT